MSARLKRRLCLFCWLAFFPAAVPAADGPETISYRVQIEAPPEILALLRENLEIMKWVDSPRMNRPFLERLFEGVSGQAAMLLAIEGYYAPAIETRLSGENGAWLAYLRVEPGEPARVGSVELRFQGEILEYPDEPPEPGKLAEAWLLPVGEVFRQADWTRAKRDILRGLFLHSYPAAFIAAGDALVDPGAGTVALKLLIDSGPQVTLGSLEISGLERYPASIIHNLNFITPDTPHSQKALSRLQRLVRDSGYFNSVLVHVDADAGHYARIPVKVLVEEKQRREVNLGLTVNTNTGAGGFAEYRDINIRHLGWRLRNRLEADRRRQSVSAELGFPPDRRGNGYGAFTSFTREDIEGLEIDVLRLGVSRSTSYERWDRLANLQFNRESRRFGSSREKIDSLVLNNSWTLDLTDDRLFPTTGCLLNLQAGGALEPVLSEQAFLRGTVRVNRYFSPSPANRFIFRGEIGVVLADSRRGIPSDYLFRTGGAWSVRGYPYQGLGVLEDGAVTGGRYLGLLSVEYNRWFRTRWALALFSDWGNATDELSGFKPALGYGAGLRVRTPVGSLNLDAAYGLERHRLAWHLSLGVPF